MKKTVLLAGSPAFLGEAREFLSHLADVTDTATTAADALAKARRPSIRTIVYDDDAYRSGPLREKILATSHSTKRVIIVSSTTSPGRVLADRAAGAADHIIRPYNFREFLARFNAVAGGKARIACIGGGTGLFNLLLGIKSLPNTHLTSIVSTTDSGGSSGRLRASFGILPPGDIRRSLVALSNAPELMNQVMQFRFKRGGGVGGHNFGNLFLAALAQIKGSMAEAVRSLSDILYIRGMVLPATTTDATLCARFANGKVVRGESAIDLCGGRDPDLRIVKVWHEPKTKCDMNAFAAIVNADLVTIGPGDLYTSVITNLLVEDLKMAIRATRAKKVYICNLMTKPGETANFDAADHVSEIVRYLGGDCLDYVLLSDTSLSPSAIRCYAKKSQSPVAMVDMRGLRKMTRAKLIVTDVSHETELVRHDSDKLKREIKRMLER